MAISDVSGGYQVSDKNVDEIVKNASDKIDGIVGATAGGLSVVGADFAGMDRKNISTFMDAINTYRSNTQAIVDGFDAEASMDDAFKGQMATGVRAFLQSVKELLKKYVEVIDAEKTMLEEASTKYFEAASEIGQSATSDSDSIRSQANGISIE